MHYMTVQSSTTDIWLKADVQFKIYLSWMACQRDFAVYQDNGSTILRLWGTEVFYKSENISFEFGVTVYSVIYI